MADDIKQVQFNMFSKDFTLLVDDVELKKFLLGKAYDIAENFLGISGYWENEAFNYAEWEENIKDKDIESFDDIREDYETQIHEWFYDLIRENGEFSAGAVLNPYNDDDNKKIEKIFLNLEELYKTFKDNCENCENSLDVFFYLLDFMPDNKLSDMNKVLADLTKEDEEYCESILGEISGAIDEKLNELSNDFETQRRDYESENKLLLIFSVIQLLRKRFLQGHKLHHSL